MDARKSTNSRLQRACKRQKVIKEDLIRVVDHEADTVSQSRGREYWRSQQTKLTSEQSTASDTIANTLSPPPKRLASEPNSMRDEITTLLVANARLKDRCQYLENERDVFRKRIQTMVMPLSIRTCNHCGAYAGGERAGLLSACGAVCYHNPRLHLTHVDILTTFASLPSFAAKLALSRIRCAKLIARQERRKFGFSPGWDVSFEVADPGKSLTPDAVGDQRKLPSLFVMC